MKLDMTFEEKKQEFVPGFDAVLNVSGDDYERGYAAGYNDGLDARTYETWTVTYVDGTVEEKKVALL